MQIFVQSLTGTTLSLEVEKTHNIQALREVMQLLEGISLTYDDKIL
jgi:hypothetical protein